MLVKGESAGRDVRLVLPVHYGGGQGHAQRAYQVIGAFEIAVRQLQRGF